MYHNTDVTIGYCEFYNTSVAIFDKSDSTGNRYYNNYFHNNHRGVVFTGFAWTDFVSSHHNITINNNLFVNSGGIGDTEEEWAESDNMKVYNNTLYGDGEDGHYVGVGQGAKRKEFYNNILYGPVLDYDVGMLRFKSGRTEGGYYYPLEIVACDHNQYGDVSGSFCVRAIGPNSDNSALDWGERHYRSLSAWQSSGELQDGSNPGEGSIALDPQFANFSGTMSEIRDFILSSDSPCKGAGRNGEDMGANVLLVGASPIADINGYKNINIQDIMIIVNVVLGNSTNTNCDINYDNVVNIQDVMMEVKALLAV